MNRNATDAIISTTIGVVIVWYKICYLKVKDMDSSPSSHETNSKYQHLADPCLTLTC